MSEAADHALAANTDDEPNVKDEARRAAGQDMLDALKSGNPVEVFHAHKHLTRVHQAEEGEADGGGDDPPPERGTAAKDFAKIPREKKGD